METVRALQQPARMLVAMAKNARMGYLGDCSEQMAYGRRRGHVFTHTGGSNGKQMRTIQ